MGFSTVGAAALNRLKTLYNGDAYGSSNPGGMDNDGHRINFIPSLRDLATVGAEAATLVDQAAAAADKAMAAATNSPKAVRVDSAQNFSDGEKATAQANLGLASVLTSFVKKTGDTLTGGLGISYNNPNFSLTNIGGAFDKFGWNILNFSSDGRLYFQDYQAGNYVNNAWHFGRDGSATSLQMGDLSARIEARASAFAAQRLALTGGTLTGNLYISATVPFLTLTGQNGTYIQMDQRAGGGELWNLHASTDKNFYLYRPTPTEGGNADFAFIFKNGGALTTAQFGDLNTRIEARGAAYRDAALTTARSEYNAAAALRVLKGGDTMTGALQVNGDFPQLRFQRASKAVGWGWLANTDNNAYLQTYDSNGGYTGNMLTIGTNGSLTTAQFGDLNTRIEQRASAYSLNAVQKSGDSMSGDLGLNGTVTNGSPGLRIVYPNNADWLIRAIAGNQVQFCDGARSVEYFSFGIDGTFRTRQFGDLNSRIETRGSAWADNAVNRSVVSIRLVYVGDESVAAQFGGGMREAYGASYVSGRTTALSNDQQDIVINQLRYRQVQFNIPNQGWVASYYA